MNEQHCLLAFHYTAVVHIFWMGIFLTRAHLQTRTHQFMTDASLAAYSNCKGGYPIQP